MPDNIEELGKRNQRRLQTMADKIKSAIDEVFQGDYRHTPHSMEFEMFFGKVKISIDKKEDFNERIPK